MDSHWLIDSPTIFHSYQISVKTTDKNVCVERVLYAVQIAPLLVHVYVLSKRCCSCTTRVARCSSVRCDYALTLDECFIVCAEGKVRANQEYARMHARSRAQAQACTRTHTVCISSNYFICYISTTKRQLQQGNVQTQIWTSRCLPLAIGSVEFLSRMVQHDIACNGHWIPRHGHAMVYHPGNE